MKILVLQENLLKALQRTERIVNLKSTLPILQNVLLEAKENNLKISATNLELTENINIGAKVEKEGVFCLPSRVFTELISSYPQDTLEINIHENTARISCQGYKANIVGVDAGEFPKLTQPDFKKGFNLKREDFLTALNKVIFAAATDEGRPLLTGIKIIFKEEEVLFVATDGYRLSLKKTRLKLQEALKDVVIPAKYLAEATRIATEEKGEKDINLALIDENQLGMMINQTEIITRLINGEYPDFQKIIPNKWNTRALLNKEQIIKAVRSAAILARENANIVKLSLDKQQIVVSANSPQMGENKIEIEGKIDGEGGEIAFNSRFLLDYLANLDSEELLFEMTGSLNPGVFRPAKDESYLHLIMPVRLQT